MPRPNHLASSPDTGKAAPCAATTSKLVTLCYRRQTPQAGRVATASVATGRLASAILILGYAGRRSPVSTHLIAACADPESGVFRYAGGDVRTLSLVDETGGRIWDSGRAWRRFLAVAMRVPRSWEQPSIRQNYRYAMAD